MRLTYFAHLYKALFRQYHTDMFYTYLAPIIKKDAVIIDVGGHAGQFAKLFSSHINESGKVYSFEPGHYALGILRTVKKFKNLHNLEIIPKALGSENGQTMLHVPIKDSGSLGFGLSFIHKAPKSPADKKTVSHDVEIITLDHFARQKNLQRLDFIKIDIEGGEYEFLKGAQESLEKFGPDIFMEINPEALSRHGASPEDIQEFLGKLGYEAYTLSQKKYKKTCLIPEAQDILWSLRDINPAAH